MHRPCTSFAKLFSVNFMRQKDHESAFCPSIRGEYSLEFLATFMALPRIKRITASVVQAKSFVRSSSVPVSHVTDIYFDQQDISD